MMETSNDNNQAVLSSVADANDDGIVAAKRSRQVPLKAHFYVISRSGVLPKRICDFFAHQKVCEAKQELGIFPNDN